MGPHRLICNRDNLLAQAALSANDVRPAPGAARLIEAANDGHGRVLIAGDYSGAEDGTLSIEITGPATLQNRVSQAVLAGAGNGTLTVLAVAGLAEQTLEVVLTDPATPATPARLEVAGVTLLARQAGEAGNALTLATTLGSLTYTPSGLTTLAEIQKDQTVLEGDGWDLPGVYPLQPGGGLHPDTARYAFGDERQVYRLYKRRAGAAWQIELTPKAAAAVPAGAPIRQVTGGRSVVLSLGTTVEIYDGIVTDWDLVRALLEGSALVQVQGVYGADLTPGGQAARDLSVATEAYARPSSGQGSDYAQRGFELIQAGSTAVNEVLVATCWANQPGQQASARLGAELWELRDGSGLVTRGLRTGEVYTHPQGRYTLKIPARYPDGYGTPRGDSAVDLNYMPRDEGVDPPICIQHLTLGADAADQRIELIYTARPSGACACSSATLTGEIDAAALGLDTLEATPGVDDYRAALQVLLDDLVRAAPGGRVYTVWHRPIVWSYDNSSATQAYSGTVEPAWPEDGGTVTDTNTAVGHGGTITWRDTGWPLTTHSPWAAATPLTPGTRRRPTIDNDNGHYYEMEATGDTLQTATTEPAWPTDGGTVVDGDLTWQDMGLIAPDIPVWRPNHWFIRQDYITGAIVHPSYTQVGGDYPGAYVHSATSTTVDGVFVVGGTEPVWPAPGGTVVDGEITWKVNALYAINEIDPQEKWRPDLSVGFWSGAMGGQVKMLPTTFNGRYYESTVLQAVERTGLTEPAWPVNDLVADGDLVWVDKGLLPNVQPLWQGSQSIPANSGYVYREPTARNGHYYRASTAKTYQTGAVEPTWPTDGSTVVDGQVIWRDKGLRTPISPAWAADRLYTVGQRVRPTANNGREYEAEALTRDGQRYLKLGPQVGAEFSTLAAAQTWRAAYLARFAAVQDAGGTWRVQFTAGGAGATWSADISRGGGALHDTAGYLDATGADQPLAYTQTSAAARIAALADETIPETLVTTPRPTPSLNRRDPYDPFDDFQAQVAQALAKLDAALASDTLFALWLNLYDALVADAPLVLDGSLDGRSPAIAERYSDVVDQLSAASEAVTAWEDPGDVYYWRVFVDGKEYLPAFTNRAYHTTLDLAGVKTAARIAGFFVVCACPAQLLVGDRVSISLSGAAWPATYQVGDQISAATVAAVPWQFYGGRAGATLERWAVRGSVAGPLAPYALDTAAPADYSAGSLAFRITPGGLPFAAGDKFSFEVGDRAWRWRIGAGDWTSVDGLPGALTPLRDGLFVAFEAGAAPSFPAGGRWVYRLRQPWAPSHAANPHPQPWAWAGATPVLTAALGLPQPVALLAVARHHLPPGATVAWSGYLGAAEVITESRVVGDTRAPLVVVLPAAVTVDRLELRVLNGAGGRIGWAWAGVPVAPHGATAVQLDYAHQISRGAGANPTARHQGAGRGGLLRWDQALTAPDVRELLALFDWCKRHHDEPLLVLPHYQRPDQALLARIDTDTLAPIDDWHHYQIDPRWEDDPARRFSLVLPLAPVVED